MACVIEITSIYYNSLDFSTVVEGTISYSEPCEFPVVNVNITFEGNTYSSSAILINETPTFFTFNASVETKSICDKEIIVDVIGNCDSSACIANYNATFCCCPSLQTNSNEGECSNGQQEILFDNVISIFGDCTFTVRMNFGDGTYGLEQTFTGPGIFSYTETHYFASPATYISKLELLTAPVKCPTGNEITTIASCNDCNKKPFLFSFCVFLEWLFLFSSTAMIVFSFSAPCPFITLVPVFAVISIVSYFLYVVLKCNECECDFVLKFVSQILISSGLSMFMYLLPFCSLINGFTALIIALGLIAIGFVFLNIWYNKNKKICGLISCDYWCIVLGLFNINSCTNISIFVVLFALAFNPLMAMQIGFALLLIIIFYMLGSNFLSSPPCSKTKPNCRA